MWNWPEVGDRLRDILAFLGGGAFLWRVVDFYRDRVRLGLTSITYDERHHEHAPVVTMELDNNGRSPLLLKREATVSGLHLGQVRSRRGWIHPGVRLEMRLIGERRMEPVTSQLLVWCLAKDDLPSGGLYHVYWIRIILRLSNRKRSVVARFPRLLYHEDTVAIAPATVGRAFYWYGYAMYRFFGVLPQRVRRLPP